MVDFVTLDYIALGWFLHPYLFMAATAWVTWVLYRREFRSKSLACLQR